MFKLVFEMTEDPEIKLPTSAGSAEKQESSRKNSIAALLIIPKPLTVYNNNLWKILKRDGNIRPPYLPIEKSECRSRNKVELDMEQQTGSKLGKESVKAVYCYPACLTSI